MPIEKFLLDPRDESADGKQRLADALDYLATTTEFQGQERFAIQQALEKRKALGDIVVTKNTGSERVWNVEMQPESTLETADSL